MHLLAAIGAAVAGAEVHHAVAVGASAAFAGDDLESEPGQGERAAQTAHVDLGTLQGVRGADDEGGVAADEGAVAGAHQLQRGRRLGAGMEGAAAGIKTGTGTAGACIHASERAVAPASGQGVGRTLDLGPGSCMMNSMDAGGTSVRVAELGSTVPEDSSVPALGAPSGFPAGTQVADRFVVNRPLGRGSSGEVLAVQDLSLDREVAMKVLRGAGGPAIARFMREARITARLDHPSVPPVHTLEFLPDGGLLFTMRRLDGVTLGEAIRRAAAGESVPVLASTNATVTLGLRICEALSRAHFLGIVHRDVKPDNIMLGAHGEVALVDWGECRQLDQPDSGPAGSTVGTPAYMSPEQARGEPADQRSDIYALGATLWHALTRRHPTWDDDPARFWEKKRVGVIDPLPAAAAARVPRQLQAILRQALHAAPAGRYATIAAFAADLERFQAGQAVAAYREGAAERLQRWLQHHRRGILVVAAMLAVCLTAGGLLWREHLRTLADWGPPILSEDFSDESWRSRWFEEKPGLWSLQDGRLVGNGAARSALIFDRVLAGAVAIEYEGEMLPGALPGDLSIVWSEDTGIAPGRWAAPGSRGYMVQAGAYDNYFCAIYRRPDGARLDQRPFRLQHGVRYRFRVELDGSRIGMWIDGQRILEAEADLPITAGHLSFYAWYPGKAFDRVRIYQKRLPEVVSVLALGESHLRDRDPTRAALAFREVVDSHPGSALAVEARYRQGLALREAGDLAAALAVWAELPPGEQAERVAAHRLDQDAADGRLVASCAAFASLYQRNQALRAQMRGQWQKWALAAHDSGVFMRDRAGIEALIGLKLQLFPEHSGSDYECGNLLNQLRRFSEVAERFPLEVVPAATALNRVGRADECLQRFADAPLAVHAARMALGLFADELSDPRAEPWRQHKALCQMGRSAELATADPPVAIGLLWEGRPERVLELNADAARRTCAFAAMGSWDQALAEPRNWCTEDVARLSGRSDPRAGGSNPLQPGLGWRLARLAAMGEQGLVGVLLAADEAFWPDWDDWIRHILVAPLARGDRGLLRERLELAWRAGGCGAGQRPRHLAGVVLERALPESLQRAPCAGEAALWQAVAVAIAAECAGDQVGARQAWRAYLDLPWHRRITRECLPDPTLEALAQWRAAPQEKP